jgi:hypothetical protein
MSGTNVHLKMPPYFLGFELLLPESCLLEMDIDPRYIAFGSYGFVYKTLDNTKVVKVLPLNVPVPSKDCVPDNPRIELADCSRTSLEHFTDEVAMAKLCSELGVAPTFYGSKICVAQSKVHELHFGVPDGLVSVGLIFSAKMDMTLETYQKSRAWQRNAHVVVDLLRQLFDILNSHYLINADMGPSNVMVTVNDDENVQAVLMVDMGYVRQLDKNDPSSEDELAKRRKTYFRNLEINAK